MDVIRLTVDLSNAHADIGSQPWKNTLQIGENDGREAALPKLRHKDHMLNKEKDTVCLTCKVLVPHRLTPRLNMVYHNAILCVQDMLADRTKSSSRCYADRIPCVLAKSLITKYQRNTKCRSVTRLVLPICGDKGKQVKLDGAGLRVPALFKKAVIPITFPKPIVGPIRQVEFFRQRGQWFRSYADNTPVLPQHFEGVVGVDRNSVGNVATLADPHTGTVLRLGPDTATLKKHYRNRRRSLQKKGAIDALTQIKRKQSRRTKDINHKVSRAVVDYAQAHCRALVLEDLGAIRKGKARKYTEGSHWSFFQLETYIRYKAALLGVPVFVVDPKNTSRTCSRCGQITIPHGKRFICAFCGHCDHRDANAAFTIAQRFEGQPTGNQRPAGGSIGGPQTGVLR